MSDPLITPPAPWFVAARMRQLFLLAALLAATACADPTLDSCSLRCGDGGSCPSGASCGPDGFCKAEGDASLCGAGGGGTGGGGTGPSSCSSDLDCAPGRGCVGGSCVPDGIGGSGGGCGSDVDCAAGWLCSAGSCSWGGGGAGGGGAGGGGAGGAGPCGAGTFSTGAGCGCFDGWIDDRNGGCQPREEVISVGGRHACALTGSSFDYWSLYCWGDPALLPGGEPGSSGKSYVEGFDQARGLATGYGHSCAITEAGQLFCWGDNGAGQAGRPRTEATVPQPAALPGSNYVAVTAGAAHSCALRADGAAFCFGDDTFHQLGQGATAGAPAGTPVAAAPGQRFRSLAAGRAHTCGITFAGTLWCWGDDPSARAAVGANRTPSVPALAAIESNFVSVAAGGDRSCVLDAADLVSCMGAAPLGDGSDLDSATLVAVFPPAGTRRFLSISVGDEHACGLLEPDTGTTTTACWGDNEVGAAVAGAKPRTLEPEEQGNARAIDAGFANSCKLGSGIDCAGSNRHGQLGGFHGAGEQLVPSRVSSDPWGFTSLVAGPRGACGIWGPSGYLACWGRNDSGQHGSGAVGMPSGPTQISYNQATRLAPGDGFTCVAFLGAGGGTYVECWGRDDVGQLGDGTRTDTPRGERQRVSGVPGAGRSITSLAAGSRATAAVEEAATLWSWGGGAATPTSTPAAGLTALSAHGEVRCGLTGTTPACVRFDGASAGVPAGPALVDIARGGEHTCGILLSDGSVVCTGSNRRGQLGDGSTTDSPAAWVPGGPSGAMRQLAAGSSHTCALVDAGVDEGRVYCWGDNSHGQLGDGTRTTSPGPVQVHRGQRFASITAAEDFTCALDAAGEPWCWGRNDRNELGDGHGLSVSWDPVQD